MKIYCLTIESNEKPFEIVGAKNNDLKLWFDSANAEKYFEKSMLSNLLLMNWQVSRHIKDGPFTLMDYYLERDNGNEWMEIKVDYFQSQDERN